MSEQRVLPAAVFDALALSAAMYGGIGAAQWVEQHDHWRLGWDQRDEYTPRCYTGHLFCAGFEEAREPALPDHAGTRAFGISFMDNDEAIERINTRKGVTNPAARVSFEEWCAELNVIRGADEPSAHDELRSPKGDALPIAALVGGGQ